MDNMKSWPRDLIFLTRTKLEVPLKKFERMMFPIRNDVTMECDNEGFKMNSNLCKLLRTIGFIVIVMFALVVFCQLTQLNTDDIREEYKEDKVKSDDSDGNTCTVHIGEKMKEEIKSWIQKEIQQNAKACAKGSRVSSEQMRSMVKEEIKRQQKTQLKPDFASGSAGGIIIQSSPTWKAGYSYYYFLFIPIKSLAPPPSIVLESTRKPGECWPMEGSCGMLLIQLAARANIVGFTMEHIDPALSLSGAIPEAPNNFSVYGVEEPYSSEKKHHFGSYNYDNKNEEESQYFRVQNLSRKSYLYILLEIASNHGNDKYTCIYRFQVHGFIDRDFHCK